MTIDINSRRFNGETFNPDCMDIGELERFRDMLSGADLSDAREWLPTYQPDRAVVILRKLGNYCACKVRAMEHRLIGQIQKAMEYESRCEGIYAKLPQGLKW